MKTSKLLIALACCLVPVWVLAQGAAKEQGHGEGLDPAEILKPLADSWTTYSGDYSGKRYSALTQINQTNVKNLTLAWTSRVANGPGNGQAAGPGASPTIIGGEGTGQVVAGGATNIRGAILEVNGILYPTTPDNAWAIDARDGREIWHYFWKTKGGTHIGNRGVGMWNNYLFMETPDNYLVSLDARTGKERWHKVISSFAQEYFSTMAPIVVGNHVLVGTGNDLDAPGFLQSFDPETGELEWKLYTVPMNEGDPGLETWKNLDAARHGGAQVWLPGSYDPETHLYITGTGNPTPAYTSQVRGDGDNLFTCSLIAVNVDTGKMQWYYQTSPHDTHDWDSAQTPILVDAPFGGRMRKLVLTAARNGYYFTLDRLTGEHLVTSKFSDTANWAKGLNDNGQPVRDPKKDHDIAGALVSAANGGATNWPPAAFSPDTGLFYVPLSESWAMYYLAETDPRGAMGLGGKEEIGLGGETYLTALDYKTGKVVWKQKYPSLTGGGGTMGLLTTAGRLLFAGDAGGNFVARDPANGNPLWHSRIGNISNAPETYAVDGRQYVLVAVGDTLYAFSLYQLMPVDPHITADPPEQPQAAGDNRRVPARAFEPTFMKIGVLTAAFQELTPRNVRDADPDRAITDWIQFARELGVDTIQLSAAFHPTEADVAPEALLDPVANTLDLRRPFDVARARRVEQALRGAGIGLSDIGYFDNLLHHDPAVRRANIEFMLRVFDAAALLGVDAVCGFVGRNQSHSMEQNLGDFEEHFVPLLAEAKARGLVYRVEPCPMPGWTTGDNFHNNVAYTPGAWIALHRICEKHGVADQFRIHYDPSHAILMGQDTRSIFQYLKDAGYGFLIGGFHVKGQVIDSKGVAAWGYGGQTLGRGDWKGGRPSSAPADQLNAWKKQTVLAEHELPGTARHDPLAYLQNRTVDWLDHQLAARELLQLDVARTHLVVEHEYPRARIQDRERLKPILQGSIAFVRHIDEAAACMYALQHEVLKAQGIPSQGVGREPYRS